MSATTSVHAAEAPRVFDQLETTAPGPTVVLCGGVHGNEPDGVRAAQRVLATLRDHPQHVCGRVIALVANPAALARGVRHVAEDLNRLWDDERVAAIEALPAGDRRGEERALAELLAHLRAILALEPRTPRLTFLDLHATSGEGPPFAILGDTLRNRRIGFALGVPVILGLEEAVDGTLLEFLSERGHVALCVEGGRADREATVENLVAASFLALHAAGSLTDPAPFDVRAHRRRLRARTAGLPRFVEIRHRQDVGEDDGFVMRPGHHHFQRVRRGDCLADDRTGPIRAPIGGRLLLPRYQGHGRDGFFLGRRVRAFWLVLSRWLRVARLDRFVHWLPGVSRADPPSQAVLVSPRIARFYATQVFHLLGYRRQRARGDRLVFTRRRPSHLPARPLEVACGR